MLNIIYTKFKETVSKSYADFQFFLHKAYLNPLSMFFPSIPVPYDDNKLILPSKNEMSYGNSANPQYYSPSCESLNAYCPGVLTDRSYNSNYTLNYTHFNTIESFINGTMSTNNVLGYPIKSGYSCYNTELNIRRIHNTHLFLTRAFLIWDLFIPAQFGLFLLPSNLSGLKSVLSSIFSFLSPVHSALNPIFLNAASFSNSAFIKIEKFLGFSAAIAFKKMMIDTDKSNTVLSKKEIFPSKWIPSEWILATAMRMPYVFGVGTFILDRLVSILFFTIISFVLGTLLASPLPWVSSLGVAMYQFSMFAFSARSIFIGLKSLAWVLEKDVFRSLCPWIPSFSNNAHIKKQHKENRDIVLVDTASSGARDLRYWLIRNMDYYSYDTGFTLSWIDWVIMSVFSSKGSKEEPNREDNIVEAWKKAKARNQKDFIKFDKELPWFESVWKFLTKLVLYPIKATQLGLQCGSFARQAYYLQHRAHFDGNGEFVKCGKDLELINHDILFTPFRSKELNEDYRKKIERKRKVTPQ